MARSSLLGRERIWELEPKPLLGARECLNQISAQWDESRWRSMSWPFQFDSVADYLRFNRQGLPPAMLQAVQDRIGSIDDDRTWEVVAKAAQHRADVRGTIRATLSGSVASAISDSMHADPLSDS